MNGRRLKVDTGMYLFRTHTMQTIIVCSDISRVIYGNK